MGGFAASLLKTVTTGLSPVGKQANRPAGEKSAPPCPLRGTSPKGKRVTGFSVALRLLTNPVPLPPRKRWQNKAPRNNYLISGTKHSTGCCAPAQRGKGGAVRHQRGKSHRRWLISVRQFLLMNLKVTAEMQPSRRIGIYHRLPQTLHVPRFFAVAQNDA